MTGFLDLISPLALYALVVALIIGLLEGLVFPVPHDPAILRRMEFYPVG